MSLRHQLDDPNSAVRRAFEQHLPRLAPVMRATWKPAMAGQEPRRAPDGAPADVLGHALSERLVWTRTPLTTTGIPLLGANLLMQDGASPTLLEQLHHVTASTMPDNTEPAAGTAVLVGLLDRAWRSPSALTEPWYETTFTEPTLDRAIAQLPHSWIEDVVQVTARSGPLLSRLPGPSIPGPTFTGSPWVGGADADLIVGTTVVEIKATRAADLRLRDAQQLIGYALLDVDDDYLLTHAAVLSARYGRLVTWDLAEVLDQAGGLTLERARTTLAEAVLAS